MTHNVLHEERRDLPVNICEYLLEGKDPNRTALLTLAETYTYGDLAGASARIAGFLLSRGARKGDRALLVCENGFFWVAAYLGILRAGLVCVPLPTRIPQHDLKYIISTTIPEFAFVGLRALPCISSLLNGMTIICEHAPKLPALPGALSVSELPPATSIQAAKLEPDDMVALMFTSGSTGKPRGVMVCGRNITANTDSIIEYLSLTDSDRIMVVLPFHYCFGASLLHTHLRVGGSMVIEPRFIYPEKALERMAETECTGFAGVPSHYQILLRRSTIARRHFPHLRYVQQAGGHLAPHFVRELRTALPDTQIFVMYGQTEATARLSYLSPEMLEAKLGSIGKGIPGVNLTVQDEFGHAVAPGQIGEIVAKGANIALGYWQDEQETATTFRAGKLYTGDLATVDEDGFIFVVDRAKDFLKCGGHRVSCRYLEDVLLKCDAVVEAAVVGAPDGVLGETVKAFVVPSEPGCHSVSRKVRDFCRSHLPRSLVPKEIVVSDTLPKNSSGKVLKEVLRGRVSSSRNGHPTCIAR
jgi:long-chain acyl-CoA synthetase